MAKKTTNTTTKSDKVEDPRLVERRRLKTLAFSKGLLTRNPAGSKPEACSLQPSKTIIKHQGTDVVKKGQRKNRFLFSFPGFIAPVAGGGKIGELSDLATGNPILYLDFPKGRMKLFGTIVYPKNKYLTLQFSRKKVLCEDSFDNIIIFSDAWWIGRKEENPEENQLNFPNELNELKHEDCDFKGGACGTNEELTGRRPVNEESNLFEPDVGLTDDTSEGSAPPARDLIQTTPLRQSARMAGKSFNFSYAENSPEEEFANRETTKFDGSDDLSLDKVISYSKVQMSDSSDDQTLDQVFSASEAQKIGKGDNSNAQSLTTLSKGSLTNISQTSKEFSHDSEGKCINKKRQTTKNANQASTSLKNAADKSSNKRGMLVQTTLSTLFGKASEKKLQHTANDSSMDSKGSSRKRQLASSHETKKMVRKPASGKRQKQKQVEDDTIEEISSDSEELEDSDAEWAA